MSVSAFSVWEGVVTLCALVGLGGLVAVGEGLRLLGVRAGTTRRFVHVGVSLFVAATPLLFLRPLPVYGLAVVFVVLNAAARSRQWWRGIHEARPKSWGTVALPLAVIPALAATWSVDVERVFAFQTAFLVLGIADPLASVGGQRFGRRRAVGESTWVGSGVCFGATILLTVLFLLEAVEWPIGRVLGAALGVAAVVTATESISESGWDNLFTVLGTLLVLIPLQAGTLSIPHLFVSLALGVGFGVVANWTGLLNEAGSVGGGLFAASLIGLGGWAWAVPAFVFFGLSSPLSELPGPPGEGSRSLFRTNSRTLNQVLANGGIAWILLGLSAVLPFGSDALRMGCYAGFLGALAAAAADTWATEIGTRFAAAPRSLRTWARVPAGTSGAVSVMGSGAALLGATSVAGAAILADAPLVGLSWAGAGVVVLAGWAGMFVDSVAGATIQARYRDPTVGEGSGRPFGDSEPDWGWAWVNNEVVNLLGTATGAVMAMILSAVG